MQCDELAEAVICLLLFLASCTEIRDSSMLATKTELTVEVDQRQQLRLLVHGLPEVLAIVEGLLNDLDEEGECLARRRLCHRADDLNERVRGDAVREVVRKTRQ